MFSGNSATRKKFVFNHVYDSDPNLEGWSGVTGLTDWCETSGWSDRVPGLLLCFSYPGPGRSLSSFLSYRTGSHLPGFLMVVASRSGATRSRMVRSYRWEKLWDAAGRDPGGPWDDFCSFIRDGWEVAPRSTGRGNGRCVP